jgi:predicted O-linked N-acetylglucosamine transferase (SPINDLY family)
MSDEPTLDLDAAVPATAALPTPVHPGFGMLDLIRTAEKLKAAGEISAAATLYAGWIANNPADPMLYAVRFNLSVILADEGRLVEARDCLDRALAEKPDFMPAHINLGRLRERLGDIAGAVAQWTKIVEHLPAIDGVNIGYVTTALNQTGRTLEATNQDDLAEAMLRKSLDIDPRQREVAQHLIALRQRANRWPIIAPWERVSREALLSAMSPLSASAYADDPLLLLAIAANYNLRDVGTDETAHADWPVAHAAQGPLRIGYVSSDLREHAVGHLMAEVFQLHDRKAVEIFAYYCGPAASDPMHQAYRQAADHWVDITGLDDHGAAARIRADGIQILVDVNGYTREGRTKLFALRPAPVIVNWLGYPGTLGSPHHHYIVADDWIIPPGDEIYYAEAVMRLPCYQPNNRNRIVADTVPMRADAGLPDDATVFCSFNGSHKITRFTFERWLAILKGVPESVLWLLSGTEPANERLLAHAEALGVARERIVFAPKRANPHHLARYCLADLFLDSLPYGAHTTASDALWMGVPVLTLSGRSFAARVCGSLVRAAGCPELVTETADAFVAQGIALGNDRARLQALRQRLLAARATSTLFDTPKLVRHLEGLYAEMWAAFRAGRLPKPDLANLETYLAVGLTHDQEAREVTSIPDYRGWWRERLATRDRVRPIPPDNRVFACLADPSVPALPSAQPTFPSQPVEADHAATVQGTTPARDRRRRVPRLASV